ncbi:MAG TPA: KH domain-containing protein [Nitrososphaera sp.]|nr:KH domain-containing protein [Nitrososphaera sp.]
MSFQHNIKLPKERIAVLIGKGGRIKQSIEKRCGVAIEVDSESGDAVVSTPQNKPPVESMEMFKAIEIISAIARGFSPQRAMRLLEGEEIFQQIDLRDYTGRSPSALARIKGRIIGEGGKSRRTIEELSGASISVYGHTVSMIGKYREIRLATDAIDMLCRGSMHKGVYNMLQEARRHDKMDRMRLWEDKHDTIGKEERSTDDYYYDDDGGGNDGDDNNDDDSGDGNNDGNNDGAQIAPEEREKSEDEE